MTASALSVLICLAYFSFAVYVFRSMRTTPPVHNPIGLIFTGVVEVVVSTITSLSVCALAGFRITMLPWCVLPGRASTCHLISYQDYLPARDLVYRHGNHVEPRQYLHYRAIAS